MCKFRSLAQKVFAVGTSDENALTILCLFNSPIPNKYSDAPALSTDNEVVTTGASTAPTVSAPTTADVNDSNEQWDDEALASTTARKAAVASTSSAELLDMKALDLKSNEQDDIAEKLRIEETKKALAAAKEGMEKEAQRIKEEREKKETEKPESKPRFAAAAATGGRWVPPHMRSGGGVVPRGPMGSASTKLDTQDENLFPDLASADAILEQKKEKPAFTAPKKTPVGGGATWGARPKVKPETKQEAEPESKPEPKPEEAPAPAPVVASAPKQPIKPIKPKKKKKKDLSTFKPSS